MDRQEAYDILAKRLSFFAESKMVSVPDNEFVLGKSGTQYQMFFQITAVDRCVRVTGEIRSLNHQVLEVLEESIEFEVEH